MVPVLAHGWWLAARPARAPEGWRARAWDSWSGEWEWMGVACSISSRDELGMPSRAQAGCQPVRLAVVRPAVVRPAAVLVSPDEPAAPYEEPRTARGFMTPGVPGSTPQASAAGRARWQAVKSFDRQPKRQPVGHAVHASQCFMQSMLHAIGRSITEAAVFAAPSRLAAACPAAPCNLPAVPCNLPACLLQTAPNCGRVNCACSRLQSTQCMLHARSCNRPVHFRGLLCLLRRRASQLPAPAAPPCLATCLPACPSPPAASTPQLPDGVVLGDRQAPAYRPTEAMRQKAAARIAMAPCRNQCARCAPHPAAH